MPTLGAAHADYKEVLDEVHEVISKYSQHTIIWTGDINAATHRPKPSANDVKFKKFCHENCMQVSPLTPCTPTFYHFNGKSSSRIDLFVQRKDEEIISNIKIHTREPLNTSPHDPVSATIYTELPDLLNSVTTEGKKPSPRVRWDKIDRVLYRELTETKLSALLANMQDMPGSLVAQRTNSILIKEAQQACPPPLRKERGKLSTSGAPPLSPLH
jgi:hypothetical protein